MSQLEAYHRPETVAQAVQLLARPGTAVLAGGTQIVARRPESVRELVDLQAIELGHIDVTETAVRLGATARLQAIVSHDSLPPLIRQMAHREGPNSFRQIGTIGGVVAVADWESELYAALLLHDAAVTWQTTAGEQTTPLAALTLPAGALITAITLQPGGQTAAERVARTPADQPIVAALARRAPDGSVRLALCGVAGRPILVDPAGVAQLQPPADFRGSASYRREMAVVLSRRVLAALEDGR